jgi:Methylase-associated X1
VMSADLAGRSYAQVYRVTGRADVHDYLRSAVERAGGEILFSSSANRAPVYLGIQGPNDERIGVLCYPFRCNPPPIRGRAPDEHRLQVRYGGEKSWFEGEHRIGLDVAGVDTTIVVGVHLNADLFIGLDPLRYDPLPMGISIEFKQSHVDAARQSGWHVWERETRAGRRRESRTVAGLETLLAFRPERLLAYVGFERRASGLGLDPPLRFRAAEVAATDPIVPGIGGGHELEQQFELTSTEILELIAQRARLAVAVRGGVAEHHLAHHLRRDRHVASAQLIDRDGEPDFDVTMTDGRQVLVECKNVSPNAYADGTPKVEVQKTRSQRGDPAGRLYRPEQFDVVAACLYAVTGVWEFRFKATAHMTRHKSHKDRLAALHGVDDTWTSALKDALG